MALIDNWQADRDFRVKEALYLKDEIHRIYNSLLIKQCSDAAEKVAAFEAAWKRAKGDLCKVELPYQLFCKTGPQDLPYILRLALTRITSINLNGRKKQYISTAEVKEAFEAVAIWGSDFLELSRHEFNDKYQNRLAKTRAILQQARREVTGLIGEIMEHKENCNNFEDFFQGFLNGLRDAKDIYDFKHIDEVEVKTGNIEGQYYIFRNSTLEGEKKSVHLGRVTYSNGGALWGGGLRSDSDLLAKNPTMEPYRIDKSGKSSAVAKAGLRPAPEISKGRYYGVQPVEIEGERMGRA